jgi:hypothetical protein
MPDGMSDDLFEGPPMPGRLGPGLDPNTLAELSEDFEGMAGVLRFEDGAVEVELAGAGLPAGAVPAGAGTSGIRELPESTGMAFSVALADGWARDYLDTLGQMSGMSLDRMLADAEAQTGLTLPEDLEKLLGDNVSLAVDSGLEVGPAVSSGDPSSLRAGVRVVGDPDEILPVVEKVKTALGPAQRMLVVMEGPGAVALGFNEEYVAALAEGGSLQASRTFQSAVPEADRASGVAYVDFDAGDAWVERLALDLTELFGGPADAEGSTAAEIRENLRALEALGISTWADDGVQRGLVRITTD